MKELGIKFDQGKLLWNLVPWEEMKSVVRVLMGGASKYSDDNWMYVDKKRYREAIMRHVIDYIGGESTDPDSGEPHLAHVVCNALFLMWHDKKDALVPQETPVVPPELHAEVKENPNEFDWDECVAKAYTRVINSRPGVGIY